ncbi:MAG: hypothetical protein GEV08_03645 [Acidimicrobiia bacterium]|nr:hypothetical protein [Acidimicrobiia bacterium]
MAKEMELFTLSYPQGPDVVWPALKRALATMDLREADDSNRTARFSTGMSWTSWGEYTLGRVEPEASGSRVVVRGRPKGSFLTTNVGEKIHASGVRRDLKQALDTALADVI